jgi:ATP-dependent DNA ligase
LRAPRFSRFDLAVAAAQRLAASQPGAQATSKRGRSTIAKASRAHGLVYRQACALGCEGIVSKRKESPYRSGRADCWLKVKNPAAPTVTREAEEEWN